ncbi:hypothetical protein BaRGS_00010611 [Batillaria attramentaria]|uniref:Uncharacterized protein n=1 Tax=Batillaria attramentaria TaxID=370345 RepID=A0ABD0LF34_9CAEN
MKDGEGRGGKSSETSPARFTPLPVSGIAKEKRGFLVNIMTDEIFFDLPAAEEPAVILKPGSVVHPSQACGSRPGQSVGNPPGWQLATYLMLRD